MAQTEEIILKTTIDTGSSTESIKSVKSELRSLTNQLAALEPGSKQFVEASKRAAQLREKIDDAKEAVKAFNPEQKFAAFAGVLGGVANGFSAVQGAMTIFSSDTKEIEKIMQRTQGAIALATGINGLMGMGDALGNLKSRLLGAVKDLFTLRGALIATGIGAFAVAIGVIVANWKTFSSALSDSIPGFDKVIDFFKNFRQIAIGSIKATIEGFKVIGDVVVKFFSGDFSEAIDSAKTFGERVANAYNTGYAEEDRKVKIENSLKDRKFQLDLEEAKGKDVLKKRLQLLKDELSILEKGSDEYNAKLIEIEGVRKQIRDKAKEEQDKATQKVFDKELERFKEQEKLYDKYLKNLIDGRKKSFDKEVKDIENQNFEKRLLLAKDLSAGKITKEEYDAAIIKAENDKNAAIVASGEKHYQDVTAQQKALKEAEINAALVKKETKEQLRMKELEGEQFYANQISDITTGLAQIAGASAKQQKALTIATTLIDTYFAAQKAYTSQFLPVPDPSSPIRGAIAAGAAVVSGLARVAAMRNINTDSPSPSGGGGFSSGAVPSAPMIAPASNATRLTNGNEPVITRSLDVKENRVYVLEKDITSTQGRVDNIRNQATVQ